MFFSIIRGSLFFYTYSFLLLILSHPWAYTWLDMLGTLFIIAGGILLIFGALSATEWIDAQTDRRYFSLTFFSRTVAPLLGGAILVIFGLAEFS